MPPSMNRSIMPVALTVEQRVEHERAPDSEPRPLPAWALAVITRNQRRGVQSYPDAARRASVPRHSGSHSSPSHRPAQPPGGCLWRVASVRPVRET